MKMPKMIIFDYGHTLLYQPGLILQTETRQFIHI